MSITTQLNQIANIMEEDLHGGVSTPVDNCWLRSTAQELRELALVSEGKPTTEELKAALVVAQAQRGVGGPMYDQWETVCSALKELLELRKGEQQ